MENKNVLIIVKNEDMTDIRADFIIKEVNKTKNRVLIITNNSDKERLLDSKVRVGLLNRGFYEIFLNEKDVLENRIESFFKGFGKVNKFDEFIVLGK